MKELIEKKENSLSESKKGQGHLNYPVVRVGKIYKLSQIKSRKQSIQVAESLYETSSELLKKIERLFNERKFSSVEQDSKEVVALHFFTECPVVNYPRLILEHHLYPYYLSYKNTIAVGTPGRKCKIWTRFTWLRKKITKGSFREASHLSLRDVETFYCFAKKELYNFADKLKNLFEAHLRKIGLGNLESKGKDYHLEIYTVNTIDTKIRKIFETIKNGEYSVKEAIEKEKDLPSIKDYFALTRKVMMLKQNVDLLTQKYYWRGTDLIGPDLINHAAVFCTFISQKKLISSGLADNRLCKSDMTVPSEFLSSIVLKTLSKEV
jgi:hypothetical protein